MATWGDIAGYIRTRYVVSDDKPELLNLTFALDGGRSQMVLISSTTLGGKAWANIMSPIATASDVSIVALLERANDLFIGGVVKFGERLWVRHLVPLENLDINEFTEPLEYVVNVADVLESKFTAGDVN